MKITIEWIGGKQYLGIKVDSISGSLELGMHDEAEAETLLLELETAVETLKEFINQE